MDQKQVQGLEKQVLDTVTNLFRSRLPSVIRSNPELEKLFSQKVSYAEGNLLHVKNGTPSTVGHSEFTMTKAHNGADKYNIGTDESPVKIVISQEGGIHRSAMVLSDSRSADKTSFGVATSEDQDGSWQPRLVILNNGNIGIGRKNPKQKLDVVGNLVVTGTINGRDILADGAKLDSIDASKLNSLDYSGNPTIHDFEAAVSAALESLFGVSVSEILNNINRLSSDQSTPPPRSVFQSATLNPLGTSSTVGVMMGLKASITPSFDGQVMIIITGCIKNSMNNRGGRVQIRYGTGIAPINGSNSTGIVAGTPVEIVNTNSSITCPFTVSAIALGMTISTTYWIDVCLISINGGITTISSVGISATE